ncbi:formate/nitrite transporter family protein [Guyparkeria halophila]|uniref:Formate/nitrite transporter family protein n=2 Tax=Guyparkeria halophila TaxID=47960 RepID=A0A6I6D7W7_9GAMM|nr:formate/nitrite transporter family protein [Guyparkeria halophila]
MNADYVPPNDLARKMVDAGEAKIRVSTRDTLIRAYMAGAILALAAAFAITVTINTGSPLIGALLFPVGFILLYLLGFDLLTGVFMLVPLALLDRRPGVTVNQVLRNWGLVFVGNFAGAVTVAFMISFILTFGYSVPGGEIAEKAGHIGTARTLGYEEHGLAGWLTIFIRGILCNWMVSTGVAAAMLSTSAIGKIFAMWMPIMLFFYMGFEHSVVNMFLFPFALIMGGDFTFGDYLLWNELPTALGNLVGGLLFVGLIMFVTHYKTAPRRELEI